MVPYKGPAHRMAAGDVALIATANGWQEAALRAVQEIEARGSGFDGAGRLVALYEPHVAYAHSSGKVRDRLVAAEIAYPKWRRDYPPTSYASIDLCAEIAGPEIACLATSWGLGQVMGFNFAAAGFGSAVEMVEAFAASETAQLRGMARFIASSPKMNAALKALDFTTFARLYNGPGFEQNAYHTKLAAAFARHRARLAAGDTRPGESAGRVTATALNLRARPSGAVLTSLPKGTVLVITGEEDGWLAVRAPDGRAGFVSARYVERA